MNGYWLKEAPLVGEYPPSDSSIIIIGSGFSGVSCAHFLQQAGCDDILLLDDDCYKAASFRNCGHILPGLVESMHALQKVYSRSKAEQVWQFSLDCCSRIKRTITELKTSVDYQQNGYLVVAIDAIEDEEHKESIKLLQASGFAGNRYVPAAELREFGIISEYGARFDAGGASANPLKFRNALLRSCLAQGLLYSSGQAVSSVREKNSRAVIALQSGKTLQADIAVLATNAYTGLLSPFFASKGLIVPFRGQIITSAPLATSPLRLKSMPFSFNHGYEYGLITSDNRLMFGGWRENTSGEKYIYDLTPNPVVEAGLKDFAARYLDFTANLKWEYSHSGIMGSSASGLPYVSTTPSTCVYVCAGFTGHGFSLAHGSAELLCKIIMGEKNLPAVCKYLKLPF